jgi:hypothetical protein
MGLEDKSSSYLFWLSEYLARKLVINIGPNAAVLLRFFEIGEMVSKGRIEDLEYQPAPKDIADFINSDTWKNLDADWMQRFGEVFLQSLPGMQGEIDALAAYIPANEEDIKLALQLGADPLDADTVIHACLNDRIPGIMAQRFHDSAHAFTDAAVAALGDEGTPLRLGYSDLEIQENVLQLRNVSIDLMANMEDILADITALICMARMDVAVASGAMSDEYVEGRIEGTEDMKCPGYGPCSGGKCQINEQYSLDAKVLRKGEASGYAYSTSSDTARAIGLWIWDYARENACSVGSAARVAREQDFFKRLYDYRKSDRVLERWCARTNESIEQGRVLSVS